MKSIEVTSFVHPKWIPALADSHEIGSAFAEVPGVATNALVPNMKGLENAEKAGVKVASLFMSATDGHNQANVNRTVAETLKNFEELIPTAKGKGMTITTSLSVAFGCPFQGDVSVEQVVEITRALLDMGSDEVNIADTIGVAHPLQVKRLLEKTLPLAQPDRFAVHFHDTEGTAVANSLAALEMGITRFDGSVGGLGGCPYAPGATGNVPTEHLVYALEKMGVDTGINLEKLYEAALFIQEALGRNLDSNGLRAFVGRRKKAEQTTAQA